MLNFEGIAYLQNGNAKQQKVYALLTDHAVMEKLATFSPILTGTIPLGIDIDESDLDIICCWADKASFKQAISGFSNYAHFEMKDTIVKELDTVIAKFRIDNFKLEIFGQGRPVKDQEAYKHMIVEYQVLQSRGTEFKQKIIELKRKGLKTEPAFGLLLGLTEDPYSELLAYKTENRE